VRCEIEPPVEEVWAQRANRLQRAASGICSAEILRECCRCSNRVIYG
jgi:hypothetical protein